MKKVKIALSALALLFTMSLQAQTVDEIIAKNIEAMGGKEKLASLKSVRMESSLSVQGMEIPVVMTRVHNVGQRVDITAMGMSGYVILTPTAGWQYMPFMGQSAAEPLPDEAVKEGADELDLQGSFLNYAEKGHKIELLGKDDVDGTECYKVKLTTKTGKDRTAFIDAKTYFVIRVIAKANIMGQEQEAVSNMSDYKKVEGGYVFPHTIGGAFGQGDMVVNKIQVNIPVDEKIFKSDK